MSWVPESLALMNNDEIKDFIDYVIFNGIDSEEIDLIDDPEYYDATDKLNFIWAVILASYLYHPDRTRKQFISEIIKKNNNLSLRDKNLGGIDKYKSLLNNKDIPIDKALFAIPFKYIHAYGL